jgi:bifunctional enzyme CysN/CysC
MARDLVATGEFLEVFVDAPLAVVEERDPKGLYKKARAGEIKHFTGIDSPYEPPVSPDLRLDTTAATADELADRIVEALRTGGYLGNGS